MLFEKYKEKIETIQKSLNLEELKKELVEAEKEFNNVKEAISKNYVPTGEEVSKVIKSIENENSDGFRNTSDEGDKFLKYLAISQLEIQNPDKLYTKSRKSQEKLAPIENDIICHSAAKDIYQSRIGKLKNEMINAVKEASKEVPDFTNDLVNHYSKEFDELSQM